ACRTNPAPRPRALDTTAGRTAPGPRRGDRSARPVARQSCHPQRRRPAHGFPLDKPISRPEWRLVRPTCRLRGATNPELSLTGGLGAYVILPRTLTRFVPIHTLVGRAHPHWRTGGSECRAAGRRCRARRHI